MISEQAVQNHGIALRYGTASIRWNLSDLSHDFGTMPHIIKLACGVCVF